MTKYFINGEPRFLIDGKSYTESEVRAMRAETARKDEEYGFADRMNGIYDKWYRYHRRDEGAAYDRGQRKATQSSECPEAFTIING